jgi:hypothetical protein
MKRIFFSGVTATFVLAFFCAVSPLGAQASGEVGPDGRPRLVSPRAGAAATQAGGAAGTSTQADPLPLRRLSLYSSGVGFFERQGNLAARDGGAAADNATVFILSFKLSSVDDALKSLSIILPRVDRTGGQIPVSVTYPGSPDTGTALLGADLLGQALPGPDLSGNPGIADILRGLRGEEVELSAPSPIRGRILAVETRPRGFDRFAGAGEAGEEIFLSILSDSSIKVINLADVAGITFNSTEITAAFAEALDRLRETRNDDSRELRISVSGGLTGPVRVSYVIPVPVWKVSYRLDLSGSSSQAGRSPPGNSASSGSSAPLLQGWAIVDNDSAADWENVELSLVSGRPVSFIQHLYVPYHVYRPTLPLAIAGTARSRTYDSALAYGGAPAYGSAEAADESVIAARSMNGAIQMEAAKSLDSAPATAPRQPQSAVQPRPAGLEGQTSSASGFAAAAGANLGDQFQFTLSRPVTIRRRQSAMLPLVEAAIEAQKTLVFSGSDAQGGRTIHPAISAELVNTTGMKLPAGPITIYDGGSYAGDALIEFFPENEKRLISYGDDLSVTGALTSSQSRTVSAVTVSRGVMTISRQQIFETVYTLRNSAAESKRLIIEHPIMAGTTLVEPAQPSERTATLYRFTATLQAGSTLLAGSTLEGGSIMPPGTGSSLNAGTFTFTVQEARPISEQITLTRLTVDSLLSYTGNQEIPAPVRSNLQRAVELRRQTDAARTALADLETRRSRLVSEQDRIRRNLEAAGNQTPQGQDYLRRLAAQDAELDTLAEQITEATTRLQTSQAAYDSYLEGLNF